ncbi:glycosyltransferase family 2 protein [Fundidesulfovibrio terrae]|uniref:glycosyltransferase family 2 protein n=1 Tax=Fundidesulfovibrio terrae TaxID=2922866 RepID=UPI001FAF6584|nr:glycosyltransferase family A protein [Fundidesulfovibrio terrae]
MNTPRVTVIMPAYNAGQTIADSIASILEQSLQDLELLVIDDGSKDRTADIARSFGDARVRVLSNGGNRGIAFSRNRGLEEARGEFTAYLDSDDISLPGRLARQVSFMENNPALGVCGMWIERFPAAGSRPVPFPGHPDTVRCFLFGYSPIATSTAMLRTQWFRQRGLRYDPGFVTAEDYDVWERASAFFPMANIPEVGVRYRVHPGQITQVQRQNLDSMTGAVRKRQLDRLLGNVSEETLALHNTIMNTHDAAEARMLPQAGSWLERIAAANRARELYPVDVFEEFLADRWINLCHRSARDGAATWTAYRGSRFSRHERNGLRGRLRLRLKCLLGSAGLLPGARKNPV